MLPLEHPVACPVPVLRTSQYVAPPSPLPHLIPVRRGEAEEIG